MILPGSIDLIGISAQCNLIILAPGAFLSLPTNLCSYSFKCQMTHTISSRSSLVPFLHIETYSYLYCEVPWGFFSTVFFFWEPDSFSSTPQYSSTFWNQMKLKKTLKSFSFRIFNGKVGLQKLNILMKISLTLVFGRILSEHWASINNEASSNNSLISVLKLWVYFKKWCLDSMGLSNESGD